MTLKELLDRLLKELEQNIDLDDEVKIVDLGKDDIKSISSLEYRNNQLVIVVEN